MSHLRHVSVYVDEPEPGHFHSNESTEDATLWKDLELSERSFPTWSAAFEVGVLHLYRLAEDQAVGPRAAGEDEDAAPVG